jgi:hypothetical protein
MTMTIEEHAPQTKEILLGLKSLYTGAIQGTYKEKTYKKLVGFLEKTN